MAIRKPSNIGVSPTTSQKLIYVAKKLGLSGIASMQGTTFNLFDTVILPTNLTDRQTLSFFTSTANKARNFTNFQNGQLNAGEAMVMENVTFFVVTLSSSNLTLPSTTINSIYPISQAVGITLKNAIQVGLMNITIANSKVVKDMNIFEVNPNFNKKTTGIALGQAPVGAALSPTPDVIGYTGVDLESPPVLPPNQKFELSLELPPVGTVTGVQALMCVVGRFGSIFAAKTTL